MGRSTTPFSDCERRNRSDRYRSAMSASSPDTFANSNRSGPERSLSGSKSSRWLDLRGKRGCRCIKMECNQSCRVSAYQCSADCKLHVHGNSQLHTEPLQSSNNAIMLAKGKENVPAPLAAPRGGHARCGAQLSGLVQPLHPSRLASIYPFYIHRAVYRKWPTSSPSTPRSRTPSAQARRTLKR